MLTNQDLLAVTRTELDSVFYPEFESMTTALGHISVENAGIFPVVRTDHSAYIYMSFMGTGLWPAIGEVETIPEDQSRVANKATVLVNDYANSLSISKDFFSDNMFDVWATMVRDFANKARVTQDTNGFGIFRNAFTTQLTPDGVAFISASHVPIGGGTVSNIVTGALTPTTLNAAMVRLWEQVDERGIIRGNIAAYLVVAPANFKNAIEITQSVLVSDSANNAVNVFRSPLGVEVVTSPYLGAAAGGSDTAWFLLSRNHGIRRLVRQGIETALVSWEYSDNRTYKYRGNFREYFFVSTWGGVVASLGT
jgi:Mu-like prophage major head subunit gpT